MSSEVVRPRTLSRQPKPNASFISSRSPKRAAGNSALARMIGLATARLAKVGAYVSSACCSRGLTFGSGGPPAICTSSNNTFFCSASSLINRSAHTRARTSVM